MELKYCLASNSDNSNLKLYVLCVDYDRDCDWLNAPTGPKEKDNRIWKKLIIQLLSNIRLQYVSNVKQARLSSL